jgi:hypothetical protein
MNLTKEYVESQSEYLNKFGLTFADTAIESLFSIIDPEAPNVIEIADNFAKNRKVEFSDNQEKEFNENWTVLHDNLSDFLASMKNNEKEFLANANNLSEIISTNAFEKNKADGLSEIIIGTLDLIVFIYNRFFELKPMIAELFKYEGDDKENEFIKILEHTFLQFAHDCKELDEDKVYSEYFDRVKMLFTQSIILCSIALMSRKTREGTS